MSGIGRFASAQVGPQFPRQPARSWGLSLTWPFGSSSWGWPWCCWPRSSKAC